MFVVVVVVSLKESTFFWSRPTEIFPQTRRLSVSQNAFTRIAVEVVDALCDSTVNGIQCCRCVGIRIRSITLYMSYVSDRACRHCSMGHGILFSFLFYFVDFE